MEIVWTGIVVLFCLGALAVAFGCASKPQPSPVVAAFIFLDVCDSKFVEAAFVRADGSIFETDNAEIAKAMDKPVKDENGRVVPVALHSCVPSQSL
jgi:hypothetical protein